MSKRIKKINQLDALRSFAAFSVIIHHFLPEFNLGTFSFGWIGVDVFFVISGYLITAILLEQKVFIGNKLLIIRNFLIKRILRLFPIYYLFISILLVLMYAFGMYVWDRGNEIYYYTYTQNILFFKEGMKGIQANHLWSLAVEEQFYLFWPWLVLNISNKNLIRSLVVIIPITLLFKSFASIANFRMLTVAHFDTLGGGALIALLVKEKSEGFLLLINKIKGFLILATILLFTLSSFYKVDTFFIPFSVFALSMGLVIGCYYNFTGILGYVLNNIKLQYLGKISYGLYLYHKPIPFFIKIIISKSQIPINNLILFVASFLLSIMIAHASYHLIEKPILKFKDKFDL